MAMPGTMVPRTTQLAGPQSFAMGGYMDVGVMGQGAQPMDSEGYEEVLKDSVRERIKSMKSRSLLFQSYFNWAHKSQNIQNLATLERLIQRVDWYCNETKCVASRALQPGSKTAMRISMVDAFRSEFRFAPAFICELLRQFDGDFLKNMECIKLPGDKRAVIGPADAKTDFQGPKMDYLHWKLRRVAHGIVDSLEQECAFARHFFDEDVVQKRFRELFPLGTSPGSETAKAAPLSQILGISKLPISCAPEEKQSCYLNCSNGGYLPLTGGEDDELPQPALPFRSIWEIPRLIDLCEKLDTFTLRNKLGTLNVFHPSGVEDDNKMLERSQVNETQKMSIPYGFFPQVSEVQSVGSMSPMPVQPVQSVGSMSPMQVQPDEVKPVQAVRFAEPCYSTTSFTTPVQGLDLASAPVSSMMSMPASVPLPASMPPLGMPPSSMPPPSVLPVAARMPPPSPWKVITPENEGATETKRLLVCEVCLKEVKFLPFLISAKVTCHASGEPSIAATAQFCLGDLETGNRMVMLSHLSPGEDPPTYDLTWEVAPKGSLGTGPSADPYMPQPMALDFSQPSITLHCSVEATGEALRFRIAIPERCRQPDWLKVYDSIPASPQTLPLLREDLRVYLQEVPQALFFSTLPSFAMSLSRLKTVLLADIDSGTMMQSRLLAAFASAAFALASLSFNFFMAQRGLEVELFASNLTQSLHNITRSFQI